MDDSSPHDSLTKTALGEEACPAASRTSQVCVWNARMDGWIVNPRARQTTTGPRQPGTPERERFLSKPRASDNAPCRMAHTSPRTPSVPELISFDTLRFTCLRRPKAEAFPPGSKSLVRGEFGSTLCDQDLAKHTTPGAEDTSEIQVIVNDPYQTLAQAKREHLTTPHDPSFWVPWCARWRERGEMEREETSQNRFIQHGLSCTCRSQKQRGLHKSDSAVKSNYGLCDLVPIVSCGQLEQGEEGGLDSVETFPDNLPRILFRSSNKGLATRETCADPCESSPSSSCEDM